MTLPLTEKQEKLWRFIASCERSPTFQEMATALGHKVRGGRVHEIICALEKKGYVRRARNCARSVVALDPEPNLRGFKTDALIEELKRRGVALKAVA